MVRRCEHCERELPIMARSHAKYCSGACRAAASRQRHAVPAELRRLARWVRHDEHKAPLNARTGRYASSTAARSWATYATAQQSCYGVGMGFVLNGDGIACIDLDHCIDHGVIAPWAQEVIDSCGSYAEVSRSGNGVHIFGYADVTTGRKIRDGRSIEVYGRGRYIAVTGHRLPGSFTLGDISPTVNKL